MNLYDSLEDGVSEANKQDRVVKKGGERKKSLASAGVSEREGDLSVPVIFPALGRPFQRKFTTYKHSCRSFDVGKLLFQCGSCYVYAGVAVRVKGEGGK